MSPVDTSRLPRALPRGERRRLLRLAIIEAMVVAAMFTVIETFLVPILALRMHAGDLQIGWKDILAQIGLVGTGLCVGAVIRRMGGPLRAMINLGYLQAGALALMAVLAAIGPGGGAWAMVGAYGLCCSIGALLGPAWVTVMAEVVPGSLLGRYHAGRLRLFIACKVAAAVLMTLLMQQLPYEHAAGPTILLAIAAFSRAYSMWLYHRQIAPNLLPGLQAAPDTGRGLAPVLHAAASMRHSLFGRWVGIYALLWVGIFIAGPFFQKFAITAVPDGLGMDGSSAWYTTLFQTSMVVRLLFLPLAGRIVDAWGAGATLRLAVIGVFIIPVTWSFTPAVPLLILSEILSGCVWATIETASMALLFQCSQDPHLRTRLVGLQQSFVGLGQAVGTGLGTAILSNGWLPAWEGSRYRAVFILSMAMRLPAILLAQRLLPNRRSGQTSLLPRAARVPMTESGEFDTGERR
jgi:predicted MFS family arabinose efflux permease